jgi:hypothetical protein
MFRCFLSIVLRSAPEIYGRKRLTPPATRLECLQRAALKKAALFVSRDFDPARTLPLI